MRETSCCNDHPEKSLAVSVSGGGGSPNTTNIGESSFRKLPFDDHFGNYHSDDHRGGHQ